MSTPILNLPSLANGAANYLLGNETMEGLESATQDFLSVDMTSGNVTLTLAQFRGDALFRCGGHTVSRNLTLAANKRLFVVHNNGTGIVSVIMGSTTVTIQPTDAHLLYSDGTANGLISVAGGAGGTSAVQSASSSGGTLALASITADTVTTTLTENVTTVTLPSGVSGRRKDLLIRVKQDATGGRTITWSGITWENGSPPTLDPAANAVTYVTLTNVDNNGWEGFV